MIYDRRFFPMLRGMGLPGNFSRTIAPQIHPKRDVQGKRPPLGCHCGCQSHATPHRRSPVFQAPITQRKVACLTSQYVNPRCITLSDSGHGNDSKSTPFCLDAESQGSPDFTKTSPEPQTPEASALPGRPGPLLSSPHGP